MFNIYTNVKALEFSNVETVIVFQTLTSLIIAYGDYKLLKSGMPSSKVVSWISLLLWQIDFLWARKVLSLSIIVVGALCYMATDAEFKLDTYFWVLMYFVAKTTGI